MDLPHGCDHMLVSIANMGIFEKHRGLVFVYDHICDEAKAEAGRWYAQNAEKVDRIDRFDYGRVADLVAGKQFNPPYVHSNAIPRLGQRVVDTLGNHYGATLGHVSELHIDLLHRADYFKVIDHLPLDKKPFQIPPSLKKGEARFGVDLELARKFDYELGTSMINDSVV